MVREAKKISPEAIKIEYDQQNYSYDPQKAIDTASKELEEKTKWDSSDHFVSMLKCGKRHVITEKCVFVGKLEPESCTAVSPHVSVDVGDHLIVRSTFGEYHSVLVYNCINEHTIISMPSVHKKGLMGRLNLNDYNEIYRINYPQSLPVEEVLRRCSSSESKAVLTERGSQTTDFVTWAKIGREVSLNISKLIDRQQIAQIRPLEYEKLLSVDEIRLGDHLFVPNLAYRWHFLVSGQPGSHTSTFSVVYCLRGSVKESEEEVDPSRDDVFRVIYPEEYPSSLAIKRARSLIGKVNVSPTARMWFVRWAKTGSDEGLEIDFLKRKSVPVAKSRIMCFNQLSVGDYLVQDKGKFKPRHHYLVISVESAAACIVIETWNRRVQKSRLVLDESVYHRIIYEEGVCVTTAQSVKKAEDAIGSFVVSRRKFVNYLKTTDAVDVDVEHLLEYRLLLQRLKVESTRDVMPGDHIEVPTKTFQKISYRNLIVTDILNDREVRVLCTVGKQTVGEVDFDITSEAEVYLIKYLERIDAEEGMEMLRKKMEECETVVSIALRSKVSTF